MKTFKQELESICDIIAWSPTDAQLENIRVDINALIKTNSKIGLSKCQGIISNRCPGARFYLKEGVDNSDLNALLAMAAKNKLS